MERHPVLGAARPARVEPPAVAPPPARPWLSWRLVALLTLIVSVLAAGASVNSLGQPTVVPEPRAQRFDQRAVATAYVDVKGGVTNLSPTQSGRVVRLPVAEGLEVPAGTLLLQIDDELPRANLASAEIDLDAAQERLLQALKLREQHALKVESQQLAIKAAQEKLIAAESDVSKLERLVKDKLKGPEDATSARAQANSASALVDIERKKLAGLRLMNPGDAIRLAELDVLAKQRQLEKAQIAVDECQVKAPCRGEILRTLVNVGELLGPMAKGPALQFCPSGERIVRAEVEQEYARVVRMGQKATVQDDVTNTTEWTGEVIGVSNWFAPRRDIRVEPMQFNDVRTLEVLIRVHERPDAPLRINQRVRVRLDGAE